MPGSGASGRRCSRIRWARESSQAVGLALALLLPAAAGAQPALEQVRVEAHVAAERPALTVTMDYLLRPGGSVEVPFTALPFTPAQLTAIRAFHEDRELTVRLDGSQAVRLEGVLLLPVSTAGQETVRVRLRFEVIDGLSAGTSDWQILIPLVVVGWPPVEASPETFVADVSLAGGAEVYRSFPTRSRRVEGSGEDGTNVYRFTLPVIPSVLRLAASTAGRPTFTFERAIDLLAVALLAGLAILGWRRFRGALA